MPDTKEALFVKVSSELKKTVKKQSIDLGIDMKDYVTLALEHYAKMVEHGKVTLDIEI